MPKQHLYSNIKYREEEGPDYSCGSISDDSVNYEYIIEIEEIMSVFCNERGAGIWSRAISNHQDIDWADPELIGSKVYLAIEIYNTGDTFGSRDGDFEVHYASTDLVDFQIWVKKNYGKIKTKRNCLHFDHFVELREEETTLVKYEDVLKSTKLDRNGFEK